MSPSHNGCLISYGLCKHEIHQLTMANTAHIISMLVFFVCFFFSCELYSTDSSKVFCFSSLCWCWRLLLEWCERKTLLAGWWLEAAAGVVWEENTVGWCWSRTSEQDQLLWALANISVGYGHCKDWVKSPMFLRETNSGGSSRLQQPAVNLKRRSWSSSLYL